MPLTPVEEYAGVSPALTQSQPDFDINTQDALDFSLGLPASINVFIDELNAEGTILTLSTSGTSTTSNTVGTGAKTFVSQTGKGWQAGNSLVIARTSDPATQMRGVVTSYNTGTGSLGFTSQAFDGSGTYTDWTITQGFAVTSVPSDLSVTEGKIANNAVTTVKILDDAVTKNKLADDVRASAAEYNTGTAVDVFLNPKIARENGTVQMATVTAASQTSIDFTGIPAWAKNIVVIFNELSTNGTSNPIVQIGDAGGIETTTYVSTTIQLAAGNNNSSSTIGYVIYSQNAGNVMSGNMNLSKLYTSNTWIESATIKISATSVSIGGGSKALSDILTQVRVTTTNGTDQFDSGSVSVAYWG